MGGMPDPNNSPTAPQKGLWGQVVDMVKPNLPTWDSVKTDVKNVLTPPDPYKAAGDMVNAYREGDYGGALEAGLGMPGIPQQGAFRLYHGSKHNFPAERKVETPNGQSRYIVGQPDVLPEVPSNAKVVQDFPYGRFRREKVGSGEGAAAYGHGDVYAAENEKVARGYAEPDGVPAFSYRGKPYFSEEDAVSDPAAMSGIRSMMVSDFNHQQAHRWLQHKIDNPQSWNDLFPHDNDLAERLRSFGRPYDPAAVAAERARYHQMMLDDIENSRSAQAWLAQNHHDVGVPPPANTGHMYELSVNAEPHQFLDWDKPLAKQQAITNKLDVTGLMGPARGKDLDRMTGGDWYERSTQTSPWGGLSDPHKMSTLSRAMEREQIPGIKFFDQHSRRNNVGTRNFVLFDGNIADIKRKYGLVPPAALTGAGLGMTQPQNEEQN